MASVKKLLMSKDCEDELKAALERTTWLKGKDADIKTLEKLYRRLGKKYGFYVDYVREAGDDSWMFTLVKDDSKEGRVYTWVYCRTLYEGLAKAVLLLYMHIKKGMPLNAVIPFDVTIEKGAKRRKISKGGGK